MEIVALIFLAFMLLAIGIGWHEEVIREKQDKNKLPAVLLLLSLGMGANAQDTLRFDYWIDQTGADSLFESPAIITIEEDAVTVRTEYEYYSRYIVAKGKSTLSGDSTLFFANCDKLRLTTWAGKVDGVFLSNKGRLIYFGIDPGAEDRQGWTNKSK